ncbi:MAG: hypothetical protein AAF253_01870 [Pseudomonadota bacterium]
MKRILKYGFLAWLLVSIVGAPFYWPYLRMLWVFNPMVAGPSYDSPVNEADARRQDLDYLSTLLKYDRSFSSEAEAEFAASLEAISADVETLNAAEFYLALAEAVALGDNGHTNISYHPQYTEFNTIGARLYWFEEGLYIVGAEPEKAHLVGRRVVGIEGRDPGEVQQTLRKYRGGNDTWRDLTTLLLLESPELLFAAGIVGSPQSVTLELEAGDGTREAVVFDGTLPENGDDLPYRRAWQALAPAHTIPGDEDWQHVLEPAVGERLRYLNDTGSALSHPLEGGGYYIRSFPGFAVGDTPIKRAYKTALAETGDVPLDYLIVDFRINDGGDYTKSMDFAKIASGTLKPDGTLYIITGPNTFSAAIVTVAMLKYYSDGRAIIIGEPMGDREQFWAERGTSFQLPNSGYYINYATGFHDWEDGCKGERHCYTMNEMHGVAAGSLAPEIMVPMDFARYANGEDVVLDFIRARQLAED